MLKRVRRGSRRRPFFVMLAIVTVGRWLMGTAFARAVRDGHARLQHRHADALRLAVLGGLHAAAGSAGGSPQAAVASRMFMALVAQVVILLSTAASRTCSASPSYFSNPMALNRQPKPVWLRRGDGDPRSAGLVVNTLLNGIAGALGWALGGLPPAAGDRR